MAAVRVLCCIVDGEDEVFKVKVHTSDNIMHLKACIHESVNMAYQVRSKRLTLWKLHEPLLIEPYNDLVDRLRKRGIDLPQFAEELHEPTSKVSHWFPTVTLNDYLYIVVKVPSPGITPSSSKESKPSHPSTPEFDQPPAKRARIREEYQEPDADFLALYKNFWQCGRHLFVKHSIQIPDPWSLKVENDYEPLNLTVIEHPEGPERAFPFGLSKLLVVEIFETFWNLLESENKEWQMLLQSPGLDRFSSIHHATIVTGQPGIGKTVFLIYVLIRRLVDGLTTIYCDKPTHAYIFDGTGIRTVTLSDGYRIPELDADPQCCALVNLGDSLALVPRVFYPKIRKGRVVVATSPDKNHWSSFAHEHLARICCMPTWSWGPLYICSLLFANKDCSNEQLDMDHCRRLRQAYSIFRGIPRICFRSLTPVGLDAQWAIINRALSNIKSMNNFINATTEQLPFNTSTSHCLVRVEPIDSRWLKTRTELLSDCIAELVFERIRMVTMARLSETLMQYLADSDAHNKVGILFKHAAHSAIRKGLTLTMTSLSDSKTQVCMSVPRVGKNEKSRYYSLAIQEKSGSQNVHADFLDLYMTPISKTEPSIDALFISSAYTTLLFQMTVGDRHPINFQGLDKVVSNLPAEARKDIRIVFVIPARDAWGKTFRGIQSTQRIDTTQLAYNAKVEEFTGFSQYVCRLDIDAEGFYS